MSFVLTNIQLLWIVHLLEELEGTTRKSAPAKQTSETTQRNPHTTNFIHVYVVNFISEDEIVLFEHNIMNI